MTAAHRPPARPDGHLSHHPSPEPQHSEEHRP